MFVECSTSNLEGRLHACSHPTALRHAHLDYCNHKLLSRELATSTSTLKSTSSNHTNAHTHATSATETLTPPVPKAALRNHLGTRSLSPSKQGSTSAEVLTRIILVRGYLRRGTVSSQLRTAAASQQNARLASGGFGGRS